MDERSVDLMFALLNSVLFGKNLTEEQKALFSNDNVKTLLEQAHRHNVLHLVAKGLVDNDLIAKDHPYFPTCQKAQVVAIYSYEGLNYELQQLSKLFSEAKISFLPLKGSVLRDYYPEPWMRSSCDIDVLVKQEDFNRALTLFVQHGYQELLRTQCDVEFKAPGGSKVELHFGLIDNRYANGAYKVLENVWDYAEQKAGFEYWQLMGDDMFYYYHLAHMAKHFENGGCGIRPFIDLFILDSLPTANKEKRDELLKKGKLYEFAEGSRTLAKVWFGNEKHTELTTLMEIYLLHGGAFGTLENRVAVHQQKNGGKKGYTLSRFFPNLKFMKQNYPYVEKCVVLLPFAYVHRFLQVIFRGNTKRSLHELKTNNSVSSENSANAKQLLDYLGLLK